MFMQADLSKCVKCRSATDEVERILAIQKNYYAVLKVPLLFRIPQKPCFDRSLPLCIWIFRL